MDSDASTASDRIEDGGGLVGSQMPFMRRRPR